MKVWSCWLLALSTSSIMIGAPAQASRIAIDQKTNPDGTTSPTYTLLDGYCDLRTDQFCNGQGLGYSVSFDGGVSSFDRVIVHGNGLLTFGQSVDFRTPVGSNGQTLTSLLYSSITPALTDYQRTLISAGQNSRIVQSNQGFIPVFYQSARLSIDNQVITAKWYTCTGPATAMFPNACNQNPYSLTLTPTRTGFQGMFDFSQGRGGDDVGYVVNGQQMAVGNSFFLPANITGLAPAVPEPASWAMMISGFGLIGGAMRRQKKVKTTVRFA
jgi:hypothetical protein